MYLFSAKNKVTLPDDVWVVYLENALFSVQDKQLELHNQIQHNSGSVEEKVHLKGELADNSILLNDLVDTLEVLNKRIEQRGEG